MAYANAGPQAMPPPAGGTSRRCVAARHATRLRAEGAQSGRRAAAPTCHQAVVSMLLHLYRMPPQRLRPTARMTVATLRRGSPQRLLQKRMATRRAAKRNGPWPRRRAEAGQGRAYLRAMATLSAGMTLNKGHTHGRALTPHLIGPDACLYLAYVAFVQHHHAQTALAYAAANAQRQFAGQQLAVEI